MCNLHVISSRLVCDADINAVLEVSTRPDAKPNPNGWSGGAGSGGVLGGGYTWKPMTEIRFCVTSKTVYDFNVIIDCILSKYWWNEITILSREKEIAFHKYNYPIINNKNLY